MMELATHLQGSGRIFPTAHLSLVRGKSRIKHSGWKVHEFGRISFKCRSCSSLGSSLVFRPKSRLLQISAFKGGRADGSKSLNSAVNITYLQHEHQESLVESSKAQNVVPAAQPTANETTTTSLATQNLFKNWLMLLRTPSQTQPVEETLEEPSSTNTPEMPYTIEKQGKRRIVKALWCYFLSLDVMIKIPLLIFTPLYLAINLVYGSKVSKELTPLWIVGPLIITLYIKMFRAICGFYVFSFKQTVKVIKNMPAYCSLACDYLFRGKLKEAVDTHLWQPLANIKNMDYKNAVMRKLKDLQVWLIEKYLDFVESIWPYYCRTIRFLKRANLM